MGFNDLLKKLFGNKSQRDLKEIEPYIQKIKAISPELEKLSNDELRHRIDVVKQHIQDSVADDRKRIAELKEHVETLDYDKRESTWEEIDKIEKEILKKIEDVLDESLPEVFAVMKETARRFSQNETVEVTANDFDRSLAVDHDFIHIEGDKAIYANHWMAGGNEVVWDMVHYDVQLIGGVVLHKGKIAEMATGEGKTLVATLPVFLNALSGNGVHVVTVNDYLSKRDSERWGLFICSTVCRWIVSTSTSRTPKPVVMHITPILHSVRTTNSVSTTCVTIWPALRSTWYSACTTMRLSMRSTLC